MIYRLDPEYYVRQLSEADVSGPYPSWFSDQETTRFSSHGKFFRPRSYYADYVASQGNHSGIAWAICHDADGHVGNISLQGLSFINRHGELALVIGDKRHWGRGVGFKAATHLLSHGFDKLNLERVHCGTAAGNSGMIRLALKLGMKEEGRRRSHLFLEGQWTDVLEFGILKREFNDRRMQP